MPMGLGSSDGSMKLKGAIIDGSGVRNTPSSSTTWAIQGLIVKNRLSALIVDDNRVNRKIHKRLLTNLGVDSQEAENGKEAVDLCRGGAIFYLILMDMDMPIMNGPQATKALREMGVCCKILGISGNSRSHEIQDFMNAGIDAFYVKPITRPDLMVVLQELRNQ